MSPEERVWDFIQSEEEVKEAMIGYFAFEDEREMQSSLERAAEILFRSTLPQKFQIYPFKYQGQLLAAIAIPANDPKVMEEIAEHIGGQKTVSPTEEVSSWWYNQYREFLRVQQKSITLVRLGEIEAKICLN
jgi:hypothetical protein